MNLVENLLIVVSFPEREAGMIRSIQRDSNSVQTSLVSHCQK